MLLNMKPYREIYRKIGRGDNAVRSAIDVKFFKKNFAFSLFNLEQKKATFLEKGP